MKSVLAFCLLLTTFASAQNWPQAETSLRLSRVVFLGENHRSARDHQGQLLTLQDLARLDDRPLLVAAEMFTTVADQELDGWLKSPASAVPPELWKREWGHPYPLYADIFGWLKANKVQVASLRPDPAFTKTIKKRPAAALDTMGEILLGPKEYYAHMQEIVAQHMPPDTPPEEAMVDRFFLVQCFWDEFMAWRIDQLQKENPNARIAVLVGNGHLHHQWGIPWRLSRRRPDIPWLTVGFSQDRAGAADLVLR